MLIDEQVVKEHLVTCLILEHLMHSEVRETFPKWLKRKYNKEVSDTEWFKVAVDYFQEYKREIYDAQNEKTQSQKRR